MRVEDAVHLSLAGERRRRSHLLKVAYQREEAEEVVQHWRHLLVELEATLDELLTKPLRLLDAACGPGDDVPQYEEEDRCQSGHDELRDLQGVPSRAREHCRILSRAIRDSTALFAVPC
jgi:hypothetical protein